MVAVPNNKESAARNFSDRILYEPLEFHDPLPTHVDIIHGWTPREIVRKYCLQVQENNQHAKLVVHLEDNEELIAESYAGISYDYLCTLSEKRTSHLLSDLVISPYEYKKFLACAHGITVITDSLLEFIPEKKESNLVLRPIIDLNRFNPRVEGAVVRTKLGIASDQFVLCYIGSVHGINAPEVKSLYLAVYLANRAGLPVTLIRGGRNVVDFPGQEARSLNDAVIDLGLVEMDDVPGLLAAADMLVQPGRVDRFNQYRLPSKIPEFLAMGKPVALPETNIGLSLVDGYNGIVMKEGNAEAIFYAIKKVAEDPQLGLEIGKRGRIFAEQHFSQETILQQLISFYQRLAASG